jgi:hypothetical protein
MPEPSESNQMDPEDLPGLGESGGDEGAEDMEAFLASLGEDSFEDPRLTAGESGEGGPSGEEETFYDATKVPEDLRATFREMQASLTKKTQSLSEKEKKLDKLLGNAGNLEEVGYKAQVLDSLLENPKVAAFLKRLNAGEDVDFMNESDPESELLQQAVERAVKPVRQELSQYKQQAMAEKAIAEFKAAHPDWKKYESGMDKAWSQNKSLDLEGAYRWAVYDKAMERRAASSKADRSVERGSQTSLRGDKTGDPHINSLDDAIKFAFRQKGLKYDS